MDVGMTVTLSWWAVFAVTVFIVYTVIVVIIVCENEELNARVERSKAREQMLLDRLEHRKSVKEIRRG